MNYYPFHIGDYVSATRHLSWSEDAAFRRLLDTYYTTEKPLPLDIRAVCRLVLATTDEQREAVAVVLEEFFEKTETGWVNTRAEAEIATMREKQEKQRAKANKRWHRDDMERGIAVVMPRHEEVYATASKIDADAMPPTPTPTPTPDISPLPPSGETKAKSVRGTRLPENWGLDPSHETGMTTEVREAARALKTDLGVDWTAGTLRYHLNEFRNHFHSSAQRNAVKIDWLAAWRNWCSKAMREMPSADPVRRDRQAAAARSAEAMAV